MTESQTPPWEDHPVFTIQPRADWYFWLTGLAPEGWAEIAAKVPVGSSGGAPVEAVRAVDERAVADGQAWAAGIWCPPSNDRRATASLLLRTYQDRGDARKAARRFAKDARRAPRIPGVDVHGYSVETADAEHGPLVVQYLDTSDQQGVVLHTCRISFFPHVKDEVVVLDCDTPFSHLWEAVQDEVVELLNDAVYVMDDES
jgi:hypothetical protein